MAEELQVPGFVATHLPKGHRLFYAEMQGALRHDWLLCVCGLGVKLDKVSGPVVEGKLTVVTETLTDDRWLEAVNQCRMAVHSTKSPCLPITLEGVEQPVREAPPKPADSVAPTGSPIPVDTVIRKKAGRPKKELAHAA